MFVVPNHFTLGEGVARRKLKACGSVANGFIHLCLISGFCLKKYTEGERKNTDQRPNILEEYLEPSKSDKVH